MKPVTLIIRAVLIGAPLLLAGCGETAGTRATTGGLIGAGGGAALGAVTGVGPLAGALVGGGAGAAGGALTAHH
ncbi:MAG TPA: hypothetical protein PLD10_24175 [Rhodopila sp.]|nr:hypothetical protein [Rhodopila sp.]